MRTLITGGSGLLGSALYECFTARGEVVERLERNEISWSDHKKNVENIGNFDCIIHTAANTNVEACENDPESCYRDNTFLTERLAYAANQSHCKFIYISSTGVYGTAEVERPYIEYDVANPTTHHHRSKLLGEQAVNHFSKESLILRTGWLFGGDPTNIKNFVARRIEEALSSPTKAIQSNVQQMGSPTYVGDLANLIYDLVRNGEIGTFNAVNEGFASRFDFVSKIIDLAHLDVVIDPVDALNFKRKAEVSDNEMAINLKLMQLGYDLLPNWQKSLEDYITIHLRAWLEARYRK
jgi:dTDP-4-dehydrorhamnose reductase